MGSRRANIGMLFALGAGLLWGCGGSAYTELGKSRDRWDRQRPEHYLYIYEATGFVADAGIPWTLEVSGFDVVAATYAGEGTAPSGTSLTAENAPTIDALFGRIQKAFDSSQGTTATYDPTWGFPTDVTISVGSETDGFKASNLEER